MICYFSTQVLQKSHWNVIVPMALHLLFSNCLLLSKLLLELGEGEKKRFMQVVTELAKAFALCATEPKAQELNAEIGFFKAVKAGIVKLIPVEGAKKTSSQIDAQLNQPHFFHN